MLAFAALALALAAIWAPRAEAREGDGFPVTVLVEPATVEAEVGQEVVLVIGVTNDGATPVGPLALHIDLTDPTSSASTDPEDWSDGLTRSIGTLAPGGRAEIDWTVKPISSGRFSFYAVVLDQDGGPAIAVSPAVDVAVAARRTLNPRGVLPVAVAAPAVVGGLMLVRRRWEAR